MPAATAEFLDSLFIGEPLREPKYSCGYGPDVSVCGSKVSVFRGIAGFAFFGIAAPTAIGRASWAGTGEELREAMASRAKLQVPLCSRSTLSIYALCLRGPECEAAEASSISSACVTR